MNKLGEITVLMSTAISLSLVKIGLKTNSFYHYAKFCRDPFLNCNYSNENMSEIFLYVMIDKRVFCGMSSKTRILTRFDDALHKLRFSLRKNCLINSRRHMAVFFNSMRTYYYNHVQKCIRNHSSEI